METLTITIEQKSYPVLVLPGRPKALLDRTVAEIYGVETRRINEAVARNPEKFPEDFYFELTPEEFEDVANCDILHNIKYSRVLPKAFTWEGCNMLSTILNSGIAIQRSIQIIRSFTALEKVGLYSLQDLAEMIFLQNKMFAALNNTVEDLKLSSHRMEKRLSLVEARLKIPSTVSIHQKKILTKAAQEQAVSRSQIMKLWSDFKEHFSIAKYSSLPEENFSQAMEWIKSWKSQDSPLF